MNWVNTTLRELTRTTEGYTHIEWSHNGLEVHGVEEIIGYPIQVKARYYRYIVKNRSDKMVKEQVTLKEKEALDIYLTYNKIKQDAILMYIRESSNWKREYLPIRQMDFEKFAKCILNGYEIKFDDSLNYEIRCTDGETINIGYNYAKSHLKNKDNIIYFKFANSFPTELTVENANKLIDGLKTLIQQLDLLKEC